MAASAQDRARTAAMLEVGGRHGPKPPAPVKYDPPIPFFVVDRPHRLQFLLEQAKIGDRPFKVGLMTTANESEPFRKMFADVKSKNVVKFVDSGVFKKTGAKYKEYADLYEKYDEMGADYGIMLDVLHDKAGTIEAAAKAMAVYLQKPRKFNLVGVAQGKDAQEYLEAYQAMKAMGFKNIAIGGMLRGNREANQYKVDEALMKDVVTTIRRHYPKDWLFVLGAYHPSRYEFFSKMGVFGSDSKAWHYRYTPLQGGLFDQGTPTAEAQRAHAKGQILGHIEREIFAKIPRQA